MWRQIQAVLLLLFFLFFQFNSFYYTPPNRNYTKAEIEEMQQRQREQKNVSNPDYKSQEHTDQIVSDNDTLQIELEFPGDDNGVKFFEEESEEQEQSLPPNNTIVESDEENAESRNDHLSEEYEYYYEYEYEVVYEEQFQEDIQSVKFNETYPIHNNQGNSTNKEDQTPSQNKILTLQNQTQNLDQPSSEIIEQIIEMTENNTQNSNQQKKLQIEIEQENSVIKTEQRASQILSEEEYLEEMNYEKQEKESAEVLKVEEIKEFDEEKQSLQNNENQTYQILNQISKLKAAEYQYYFARICNINENTLLKIEQEIPLNEPSEEYINKILLIHSFVVTLIVIILHFQDKKEVKKENNQTIYRQPSIQIIELNEYMTMMLERLEQQYYFIIKSQEQLTCQLELLEQ